MQIFLFINVSRPHLGMSRLITMSRLILKWSRPLVINRKHQFQPTDIESTHLKNESAQPDLESTPSKDESTLQGLKSTRTRDESTPQACLQQLLSFGSKFFLHEK